MDLVLSVWNQSVDWQPNSNPCGCPPWDSRLLLDSSGRIPQPNPVILPKRLLQSSYGQNSFGSCWSLTSEGASAPADGRIIAVQILNPASSVGEFPGENLSNDFDKIWILLTKPNLLNLQIWKWQRRSEILFKTKGFEENKFRLKRLGFEFSFNNTPVSQESVLHAHLNWG